MWRIYGVDKVTGEVVDVAIADNPAEKGIILRQEEKNYHGLKAVRIRILSCPNNDGDWRARMTLST